MLRGVNHSIIEINNTENKYFDKAILFLKPDAIKISPAKIKAEANELLTLYNQEKSSETILKSIRRKRLKRRIIRNRIILGAIIITFLFLGLKIFNAI